MFAPAQQDGSDHPMQDLSPEQGKGKGRSVKTPLQKEVLEASYALNANPTAEFRKKLAERIGLTEDQVQTWFTGRRRRDKKKQEGAAGAATPATPGQSQAAIAAGGLQTTQQQQVGSLTVPAAATAAADDLVTSPRAVHRPSDADNEGYIANGGTSSAGGYAGAVHGDEPDAGGAGHIGTTPILSADAAAAMTPEFLEAAKASLPVPYREDGPPLSFVFDSVPGPNSKKGMQAAALMAAKRKKLPGAATSEGEGPEQQQQGPLAKKPKLELDISADALPSTVEPVVHQELVQQQAALPPMSPVGQTPKSGRVQMKAEKERQREEARRAKETEKARQQQEREAKKREAQLERERRAEEKRKAQEDKRRERELAKALQQQERAAARGGRARGEGVGGGTHHYGPPDDLDLEMEALMVRARASAAAQAAAQALHPSAVEPVVPPRPEFPPSYVLLQPAFPTELGDEPGSQLIEAWGFVTGFADMLGLPAFSLEALLEALVQGSSSSLLGLVHVVLLQQAQADMEEAHATGVLQSPQISLCDRALVAAAQRLEEAWAWGLDPDLWRAHLGPLTWPEVLRQHALAGGAGSSRVLLKQNFTPGADGADGAIGGEVKKKKRFRAPKGSVGYEGEDVVSGWTGGGPLKLQCPRRFGDGTWMSAAWKVLAEAGPEGVTVPDVIRKIAERGYRDLSTSKNPEASVTGALSRDILFTRIKPGTYGLGNWKFGQGRPQGAYALQSIVTFHQRMQALGKPAIVEPPHHHQQQAPASGSALMDVDNQDEGDSDDEGDESDDDDTIVARAPEDPPNGAPWVTALKHGPYDSLTLADRLAALLWLTGLVNEGPGVRAKLEAREKEAAALRKQLQEDMKTEKKRRQDEAALRMRLATEEAQLRQLEDQQRALEAAEQMGPEAVANGLIESAFGGSASSRAATPVPPAALPPLPPPVKQEANNAHAALSVKPEGQSNQQQPLQQDAAEPDKQQQQQGHAEGAEQPNGHEQQEQKQETSSQELSITAQQQNEQHKQYVEQQLQQQEQVVAQLQQQLAEFEIELATETKRRAARAGAIRRYEELNALRLEPLGMDRRFNRYWLLISPEFSVTSSPWGSGDAFGIGNADLQLDASTARLFIESADGSRWWVMLRAQQLDQLKQVLEPRGVREGQLAAALVKVEGQLRAAMPGAPLSMPTPIDQQPHGLHGARTAAAAAWCDEQALVARTLTSWEQESAIASATASRAGIDGVQQLQLKQNLLRVEELLSGTMQAHDFDRQDWIQSVVSAPDLLAVRTCLAQLEAAVISNDEGPVDDGRKTRGQRQAEKARIPFLAPVWQLVGYTPCVKGAWLACGVDVAAARLGQEGFLQPVLPAGTVDAAAAAVPADPAAAATAAPADQAAEKQESRQDTPPPQQQLQQYDPEAVRQQLQSLTWLPTTVHALSLRLAALDSVLRYPQLGQDREQLFGREVLVKYRYITKPAPIHAPATLEQLLAQEATAVEQLTEAASHLQHQQQQQNQQEHDAQISQQQQQQAESQHQQQQQNVKLERDGQQQPEQHRGQQPGEDEQQQQQQQSDRQLQQQQQVGQQRQSLKVPSLDAFLSRRIRCVYGYSLSGRGLLQLIRGLPPFPDWVQQAKLDDFIVPVSAYQQAVQNAQENGTFKLTFTDIRAAKEAAEAAARAEEEAKERAKQEAKAAKVAAVAAAAAAAEQVAKEAAAAAAPAKQLPPKGKGGFKIKLKGDGKAAAAAAAGAAPKSGKAGAGEAAAEKAGNSVNKATGKQQQQPRTSNSIAALAPKLKIKPRSREQSRESTPVAGSSLGLTKTSTKASAAGGSGIAGGGSSRLKGRLKLKPQQKQKPAQEEVDEQLLDEWSDDDD